MGQSRLLETTVFVGGILNYTTEEKVKECFSTSYKCHVVPSLVLFKYISGKYIRYFASTTIKKRWSLCVEIFVEIFLTVVRNALTTLILINKFSSQMRLWYHLHLLVHHILYLWKLFPTTTRLLSMNHRAYRPECMLLHRISLFLVHYQVCKEAINVKQ